MDNRFVIGIAGGTGSGKTTLVKKVLKKLPSEKICTLSQDSYYRANDHLSLEERKKINFDHPSAIDFELLIEHLEALKSGKSIQQPVYSFADHNRTKETKETFPKNVVIVEGILIFNDKTLRDLCDIKIYIEADDDERLIRRVRRDSIERGRDVNEILDRYQDTLKPMHRQFIEPTKNFADIIILNNHFNKQPINIIKTLISEHL